jgi:hypothetical protein
LIREKQDLAIVVVAEWIRQAVVPVTAGVYTGVEKVSR